MTSTVSQIQYHGFLSLTQLCCVRWSWVYIQKTSVMLDPPMDNSSCIVNILKILLLVWKPHYSNEEMARQREKTRFGAKNFKKFLSWNQALHWTMEPKQCPSFCGLFNNKVFRCAQSGQICRCPTFKQQGGVFPVSSSVWGGPQCRSNTSKRKLAIGCDQTTHTAD